MTVDSLGAAAPAQAAATARAQANVFIQTAFMADAPAQVGRQTVQQD